MNTPLSPVFDVFLSHAHCDGDVVEKLGDRLEREAQLQVWLDRWILVPGERWLQKMAKGLLEAKTCAVCIGRNTPVGWFQQEIERALNRQVNDNAFRVIPIILPQGTVKIVDDFLELRTWVDFSGGLDDEYAFNLLKAGIIGGRPPKRRDFAGERDFKEISAVRRKLEAVRELRLEGLLDEDIALEAQRMIVREIIE
jgi:hypothetical protein